MKRDIIDLYGKDSAAKARRIIAQVAEDRGCSVADIMGRSKLIEYVGARFDAIQRVHREMPGWSRARIARFFGYSDHTTVLRALRADVSKYPTPADQLAKKQRNRSRAYANEKARLARMKAEDPAAYADHLARKAAECRARYARQRAEAAAQQEAVRQLTKAQRLDALWVRKGLAA
jgi:hypothetical protein